MGCAGNTLHKHGTRCLENRLGMREPQACGVRGQPSAASINVQMKATTGVTMSVEMARAHPTANYSWMPGITASHIPGLMNREGEQSSSARGGHPMHVFERQEQGFFGGLNLGSERGCIVCMRVGMEGSGGCAPPIRLADSWAGTKLGVGRGRAMDCIDMPTRPRDAPTVRKRLGALFDIGQGRCWWLDCGCGAGAADPCTLR